jgi:hypothetical protein
MLVKELLEVLSDHDPNMELTIVTDRYTGPFAVALRGVVQTSSNLYLCGDYVAKQIDTDPWAELDGPMYDEKGE